MAGTAPASGKIYHLPDLESLRAEFEALAKELAEKELELATVQSELSAFESRYAGAVGVLYAELDALEREIALEQCRLHPNDKPYQQTFQKAEQKARTSQEKVNETLNRKVKKDFKPSKELQDLYRKVAKAIHPDFAASEEERQYRTTLMSRANAAYQQGDTDALEQILVEWENWQRSPHLPALPQDEFSELKEKILRANTRMAEIKAAIERLKSSDLYRLLRKVERAEAQGFDLLAEMARDIQRQIQGARHLLESLREQGRAPA